LIVDEISTGPKYAYLRVESLLCVCLLHSSGSAFPPGGSQTRNGFSLSKTVIRFSVLTKYRNTVLSVVNPEPFGQVASGIIVSDTDLTFPTKKLYSNLCTFQNGLIRLVYIRTYFLRKS
jgi:hypothetical protein